jgi:L-alanine-DL-glutamate epimerase-like enolase superfamily enzyme/DNA-binding HxlR family transcriptional regulator
VVLPLLLGRSDTTRVKDYQQYCPIARGAEIFAERWTPLIIRNLFLGCTTLTEIREGAPGIPKTVLSERLAGLARRGVVERRPNPAGRGSTYHLTPSGQELVEVCFALGDWGAKWLDVAPEQLDSHVVLWSMARLVDRDQLPTDRVVIRFDLTDLQRKNRFWMVLERDHTEVCLKNPGFPEQVLVTTTSEWLAKWHMGWISMPQACAQGLIKVEGPPRLTRAIGTWGQSPFRDIHRVSQQTTPPPAGDGWPVLHAPSQRRGLRRTGTRVTGLDATLLRVPTGARWTGFGVTELEVVHVTLTDGEGGTGTGFTFSISGGAAAMRTLVDGVIGQATIGSDLEGWERRWHALWARTHRLGRGVAVPALSAVDIAVWDLRARRARLPLYRLLGAYRDQVPAYRSLDRMAGMSLEELVEAASTHVAEGFAAIKLFCGARPFEEEVDRVAAVRQAVGPAVRIMVDTNERLDQPEALWFGRQLAAHDIYWLEEPLASDDIAGHARLAQRLAVPIAVGEHLIGRFEFAEYLRQGAAAVVQPDLPLTGGISEGLRVATLAEAHGAALCPHSLPELHVHLVAAAKAGAYVECFPLLDDLLQKPLQVSGGVVRPPERPGHGILWSAEALERYRVR